MKKRLLVGLLVSLMLLQVGCSASKEDEKVQVPVKEQETVTEPESEMPAPPSESETPEDTVFSEAPKMTMDSESIDRYNADGDIWLFHADYDVAHVEGVGYDALMEGVQIWSEDRLDEILAYAEQSAVYAEEYVEMMAEENYRDYYYFSFSRTLQPMRVDAAVVSLLETIYDYSGGAHGNYGHEGITFDAQTGELLTLSAILADEAAFYEKAISYITDYVQTEYGDGLFPDYAETIEDMKEFELAWYLDAAGITFIFDPYMLGPYAMGDVWVTLPMAEFAEYMKEEYRCPEHLGYSSFPINVDVPVNTPLSSQAENILRLNVEYKEEFGMSEVTVQLNDSVATAGMFDRVASAYLMNIGMFQYLILDVDYASDDYVTLVYNVSTGAVRETDRLEGSSIVPTSIDGDRVQLRTRLDVFGTYGGMKTYTLDGKSGKLQTEDEFYEIHTESIPAYELVTVREMLVMTNGIETALPAGSRIRIIGTDNEGIAIYEKVDTGESGEIHYVRGDGAENTWTIHVDGVPDQEYFEEYLPYAG